MKTQFVSKLLIFVTKNALTANSASKTFFRETLSNPETRPVLLKFCNEKLISISYVEYIFVTKIAVSAKKICFDIVERVVFKLILELR